MTILEHSTFSKCPWVRDRGSSSQVRRWFRHTAGGFEENLGLDARCELVVRRGDPAQAILEVEKQLVVDLIVMATHGRTGLKYLFLGSVAVRIVRESIVPVLTVRGQP